MMISKHSLVILAVTAATIDAFVGPQPAFPMTTRPSTSLAFGIPSFFTPKDDGDDNPATSPDNKDKKIGLSGVVQLITAGMGAPFLGDYEGVDEETGKFMFSLEANNLVDENGQSKQTSMPYFENGWVDEDAEPFKWPWQK